MIFFPLKNNCRPLSEGKALKVKFDDIFASTRYVKALDCIRKFRQEQVRQINVFVLESHMNMQVLP